MRISEMDEALKIQGNFFYHTVCEMRSADYCAGKVSFFEDAFFESGFFQFGIFETNSGQVAEKEDASGQISPFEFARGKSEFLGGQVIRPWAFFKDTILHDSAREIAVSEFDGQKV